MRRSTTGGFVLGTLAALLWSSHFYAVAHILQQPVEGPPGARIPALVLHFYVVLGAALAAFLVLMLTGRMAELSAFRRLRTRFLVLVLSGGYGFWLLRALALERAIENPANVQILFYAGPLLLGLFSLPGREGARGRELAALLLGFVGCIMIIRPAGSPGLGTALLAVGAAACWAVFTLAARSLAAKRKLLPVVAVLFGMGAVLLLATCLSRGEGIFTITRRAMVRSMLLGALTVALAFGCWMKCLSAAPPSVAASLWYLAVVFGIASARWVSAAPSSWWTFGGAVLVLLAVRSAYVSGRPAGTITMSDMIRG